MDFLSVVEIFRSGRTIGFHDGGFTGGERRGESGSLV